MRKRSTDILTTIGLLGGFLAFAYGVISGHGIEGFLQFIDIPSVFITMVGTLATVLISVPPEIFKKIFTIVRQAFYQTDEDVGELIQLFVRLSDKARREGLLSLEAEVEEIDDPFIQRGILLAVDGVETEVIIDILTADIAAMEERHRSNRSIFERAGQFAPAWGMLGTLIGLILMLNELHDVETLGPKMATALITTLYGVMLANWIFLPTAAKLEAKTEQEVFLKQVKIEGIIGVQTGQNPKLLEEKLTVFLSEREKIEYENRIKDEEV